MKLNYKGLKLPEMFIDGLQRGKDKTFIFYQRANGKREEYSYNEILKESNNLSIRLKQAGLKKGDRIGVVSAMRPLWYSLCNTCLQDGYIMVCIDPGVPVNQMQKMLLETEVRAIFTSIKNIHLPKEYDGFIPVYDINTGFPQLSKCSKVNFLLGEAKPMPEKTFFVLFSSGTTGENRKAVLISPDTITVAIEFNRATTTGVYKNIPPFAEHERDLLMFPPYHIAGILCICYELYDNTQIILLERLTPNALTTVFKELKPDNLSTVPAIATSLYKKIVAGYSSKPLLKTYVNSVLSICSFLRKNFGINAGRKLLSRINKEAFGGKLIGMTLGASPLDINAHKFFLDMGIDISMSYGLTELGAPLATTGQGYYPGTTGRAVRYNETLDIRIINKDASGKGEVEVLSPYRMISYLDPKDNEGCFTEDGYFKTGDLGYFDSNDCLVICGRAKETIVLKNGEKLLPEEIESKYQEMDSVQDVAVFKVPGVGGCDDFAIAITVKKGTGIPEEALKVRVYERANNLPHMYRPKDVYVVKELPYSSSHKVQRFRLTEMAIKGLAEPETDANQIPIDEDITTTKLRKMLVEVGGPQWKNEKLTQGLNLNLDSLSMVNLFVAIQEEWGIDLFQTDIQPNTFGELLDVVKNFDELDKTEQADLDLSQYPMKSSAITSLASRGLEKIAKLAYRIKSYGIDNLPKDTNYLLCSNHRTDLDPVFIQSILPISISKNTCSVGKAQILDNKILKPLVNSQNFIPVDRTGNSIQTLNRCNELLEEGWNVLIFPEGTSVQNHEKLFPLKDGSARLSIATQKPIVPICISGVAYQEKEMGSFGMPKLESNIVIRFGKPIYPGNMSVQEINELLTKKIEELNY